MDLSRRSYQKELLDADDIPFADIARNMSELNFINTHLGGHAITIHGLKTLLQNMKYPELSVCEIGCGGGDNLQVIYDWGKRRNIKIKTLGIDINSDCIEFAKTKTTIPSAEWISSDYQLVHPAIKPDIIFNSLFCHHFNDDGMISILKWMNRHSQIGFFINDLHRHTLAFYSIKLLTRFFSKSYLVKNDAPLSVARGFSRDELKAFLMKAEINNYSIQWKWAFRWLVTSNHKSNN